MKKVENKTIEDYRNTEAFDGYQLEIIEMGLEWGLDVSVYADPKYNDRQMWSIRAGQMDNLDISKYADPEISADIMEYIRNKLRNEKIRKLKTEREELEKLFPEQLERFSAQHYTVTYPYGAFREYLEKYEGIIFKKEEE